MENPVITPAESLHDKGNVNKEHKSALAPIRFTLTEKVPDGSPQKARTDCINTNATLMSLLDTMATRPNAAELIVKHYSAIKDLQRQNTDLPMLMGMPSERERQNAIIQKISSECGITLADAQEGTITADESLEKLTDMKMGQHDLDAQVTVIIMQHTMSQSSLENPDDNSNPDPYLPDPVHELREILRIERQIVMGEYPKVEVSYPDLRNMACSVISQEGLYFASTPPPFEANDLRATIPKALYRRLMLNIARNAVKANQVKPTEKPRIEVSFALSDEDTSREVIMSIRDHGPGYPPQVVENGFQPGVTEWANTPDGERLPGNGIGMAHMSEILQQHYGIRLEPRNVTRQREDGTIEVLGAELLIHFPA